MMRECTIHQSTQTQSIIDQPPHLEIGLDILQVLLQFRLYVVDVGRQAAQRALKILVIGIDDGKGVI